MIAVDVEKCLACKSCELACAIAHSVARELLGATQERPQPRARVMVMAAGEMAIPLQCRQCEDAPCVAVCPAQALQKPAPDSPVTTRPELCIGCKSCVLVCPFGVISVGAEGKAIIKCDLCLERLEQGEEPACVAACPTHALSLKEVEEIAAEHRRAAAAEMVAALGRTRQSLRAALGRLAIGEE
jgi:carbon-monoxide dehydrogenase iron sulfur subunit